MEQAQRITYPNLGKMALDMLSIPAMSAAPERTERLFSGAGMTITERRNRLGNRLNRGTRVRLSWYKAEGLAWADD
jgi:hypothetical protein